MLLCGFSMLVHCVEARAHFICCSHPCSSFADDSRQCPDRLGRKPLSQFFSHLFTASWHLPFCLIIYLSLKSLRRANVYVSHAFSCTLFLTVNPYFICVRLNINFVARFSIFFNNISKTVIISC